MIEYNLKDETIDKELARYNAAALNTLSKEADIIEVVNKTAKKFSFNDDQTKCVLNHFIKDNDFSQWGLANAVTRTPEDLENYDTATIFEGIGGKIVELDSKQFKYLVA